MGQQTGKWFSRTVPVTKILGTCKYNSTCKFPSHTNFYADLRLSFLKSFIKDQRFQMSVQGLGTATWQLQGRVMLKADVRLRTARQRIRDILLKWHGRLGLSADAGHAFKKLLESKLVVKSLADDEPFAGDSHWWTPESPPVVVSVSDASC